jgi:hypothetical protein
VFGHLFAEFQQRSFVGFGFDLRLSHFLCAIGDLGRAAVAMIHRDHFRNVVQFDRGRKIIPERRCPCLEHRRDHADQGAGERKLAVFADHFCGFSYN